MFDIFGSFNYEGKEFGIINCDKAMYEELWSEVLYVGIINAIDFEKKEVELTLKYKVDEYLEYYGDYALISFDNIASESLSEMSIDHMLFYDKETKLLALKKLEPLTEEQQKEVDEKVKKWQEIFDYVLSGDEKEGD